MIPFKNALECFLIIRNKSNITGMLSTVVLSNENQTCRGWEAPTSIGGEDVTIILYGYAIK